MGQLAAVSCYVYWGLIVVYWTWLNKVESEELLMHRVVWTFLIVLALMAVRGSLKEYCQGFANGRIFRAHLLGAVLLALNWYLFVYGVTNDRITDASLGYFLCPFVSIFWGRVMEKEKLNRVQILSIVTAMVGVGRLSLELEDFPYIATGIALTWGTYSMLKKRIGLGIFSSLGMEITILAPFAAVALYWFGQRGELAWGTMGYDYDILIASTGGVTMIPLLLYSYAVKRVSLTTMGLLQYIMPTMALGIAVFVYEEPFGSVRLFAFSFIWLALAIYAWNSIRPNSAYQKV